MSANQINKSVLLPYRAQQLYALVERIEDYPQFLPWCSGTEVQRDNPDVVVATVRIDYLGLRQSFTTRNLNTPHQQISLELVDGPFSELEGRWQFEDLGASGCKVQFALAYTMRSGILGRALAPVFGKITGTMVDAFVQEADQRYGANTSSTASNGND
jgi:ribosome-associated toxin RatA of RatAB toxin-antitoxin module